VRGLALIVRAGAVVCASAFLLTLLVHGAPKPAVASSEVAPRAASTTAGTAAAKAKGKAKAKKAATRRGAKKPPPGVVAVVATGDIVMGSTPNLPPDGGRSFFSDVQTDLAGDVVLGNLEGTLSSGGSSKCGKNSTNCFAFHTPPSYARWLAAAGFTVMNLANNHAMDYGQQGLDQTIRALEHAGLRYTGRPDQITVQKVGAIRVAIVGFAPYPWAASLTDVAAAKRLVRAADRAADVVVVTMHAGAEGSDRQHVRPGTERFLGENRGDPIRFAHAVVDAGADLVVGSGPHVLRGMEWYKHRLIAYSLGNFAGYKVFSLGGPLSTSAILRVTLAGDGSFETGRIVPTHLVGSGVPALDPSESAHGLIRTLSREDFGRRAVTITPDGFLTR
jgi:poly-gamma-glutamate capsule biosynthesis protein CapA/YwtB (metallophosphatase superfamily)